MKAQKQSPWGDIFLRGFRKKPIIVQVIWQRLLGTVLDDSQWRRSVMGVFLLFVRPCQHIKYVSKNLPCGAINGLKTQSMDFITQCNIPGWVVPPQVIRAVPLFHEMQLEKKTSLHRCAHRVHAVMYVHFFSVGNVRRTPFIFAGRWSFIVNLEPPSSIVHAAPCHNKWIANAQSSGVDIFLSPCAQANNFVDHYIFSESLFPPRSRKHTTTRAVWTESQAAVKDISTLAESLSTLGRTSRTLNDGVY